jgi:hypothetical protein
MLLLPDQEDIRLVIKISNKDPIDLMDLTNSLSSFATQFSKFVEINGQFKEAKEAKLFVKEIKSGSVIVELVEYATISVLPFLENTNTIIEFSKYCSKVFNYFLNGEGQKPDLTKNDIKDFSSIIEPVAKDNASQLNISSVVNGNVYLTINYDSRESNAIQNSLNREREMLKEAIIDDNVFEKVLLVWFQARGDLKSKAGNKAIVEDISKKEMNIIFDDDSIKEKMLLSETNPFKKAYVVDLKIMNANGKPTAYKIIDFHESIELDS